VKLSAAVAGVACRGAVVRLLAGTALRGDVEPVEAAICEAEKARRTAITRSDAALFIITFLLAFASVPVVVEVSAECAIQDTMCRHRT
jgi:hypothetical protein